MFSGIIEDTGTLVARQPRGNGCTLSIRTALAVAPEGQAGVCTTDRVRIGLGDSVAVMGACLTVEAVQAPDVFQVAAGAETLALTTLGTAPVGSPLHLERALRVGDRLDGHIVSGHVDAVGEIEQVLRQRESVVIWVSAPRALSRYLATKGSICVDGVSLTVNELRGDPDQPCSFRVNVVPYTATHTAMGGYRPGVRVNLEADVVARYLERLLVGSTPSRADEAATSLTAERMAALGFTGRSR